MVMICLVTTLKFANYLQTKYLKTALIATTYKILKNTKPLRTKSEGLSSVGDTGFEPVTPCL